MKPKHTDRPRRHWAACILLAMLPFGVLAQDAVPASATIPVVTPAVVASLPEGAKVPRVTVAGAGHPDGYEGLRIVHRADTGSSIALQVGLNVGLALLTRGVAFQSFSKDDLRGTPVEGIDAELARNPAISELPQAVAEMAVRLHAQRKAAGEAPDALPDELPVAVFVGPWSLVYENLAGSDELYRLRFGAALNWKPRPFAVHARPQGCSWKSDALTLTEWQANDWQQLREQRAMASAACQKNFEAVLADWI